MKLVELQLTLVACISYFGNRQYLGAYTIIVTFAGSESYWSSYGETAIGVSEGSSFTQLIEFELTEATTEALMITLELAIIVAVAFACVIGLVAFWAIRKND